MSHINCQINLDYYKGHTWKHDDKVWFIGYFFDRKNHMVQDREALTYFKNCASFKEFKNKLSNADGIFSVVIRTNDAVFIASDRSRLFTVFYTSTDDHLIVTDSFYKLQEINHSFDVLAKNEFLSFAFTSNNRTLAKNVKQIRPGEAFFYDGEKITREYFTSFATDSSEYFTCSYPELYEEGYNTFETARARLANSLKNKKVLLPLSGGFDSRLIASWLKLSGINDVVCLTYGRKGSPEVAISQKVARTLGFDWHYIEYNNKMIANFTNDPLFHEYYKYMSRGNSMFYMQEYFAVKTLIENGVVDKTYVAIPGHAGGYIAGNNLVRAVPVKNTIKQPARYLFKHYYTLHNLPRKDKNEIISDINTHWLELKRNYPGSPDFSIMEDWLLKERIAKYLFNSSHVFTFFDMEIRLPFWDNVLFDFWRKVPPEYRCYKKLFKDILNQKYFSLLAIKQKKEPQPGKTLIHTQNVKNKIRPFLPLFIKHRLLKKNDWVFYDEITHYFLDEMKSNAINTPDNGTTYHNRILNWYLWKLGSPAAARL